MDVGIDPKTGRRKQRVRSGFRTREEAEAARNKELAALTAGTWTDDQGITLGEWLDRWLAKLTNAGRAVKTVVNYRTHVRDVWKPRLGHLRLRDVRRAHIEQVIAEVAAPIQGERRPGNIGRRVTQRTATTVESYRKTIRAALSAAVRAELIATNPAAGQLDTMPSAAADDDDTQVVWEPEETARFLEHVRNDRLSALYELAAYAGLRRAELCGLRWSDIDDAGLTVRQTIVEVTRSQVTPEQIACPVCGQEHVGRLFKRPKSRRGRRWVPLATPAREALERHRKAQQAERDYLGDGYADHDLVFADPTGLPLRPGSITAAFEAHAAACGLPPIRLHDIRHGACSLLLAGGVPIEVVQMILGHASPDITRKVYAHVLRKVTAAQVEQATNLLTRLRPQRHTELGPGEDPDGNPDATSAGALVPA